MTNLMNILTALAVSALMATTPALAQDSGAATEPETAESPATEAPADAPTDAPASETGPASSSEDGLSMGQEVVDPNAPGQPYDREEHGAWTVRCVRNQEGKKDPCELYQLLKGTNDIAAAEISMFALPEGQQAAAGAIIAVPLETLLTQQITLTVDGGQPKRYPFSWCSRGGCFARVGFTTEDIAAFKAGSKATITIVPLLAPDQKVVLDVSLSGFTAGYDAVAASNAE